MAISDPKYSPLGWNGHDKDSKLKKLITSPIPVWKELLLTVLALSTTVLAILLIRQKSSQLGQDLRGFIGRSETSQQGNSSN